MIGLEIEGKRGRDEGERKKNNGGRCCHRKSSPTAANGVTQWRQSFLFLFFYLVLFSVFQRDYFFIFYLMYRYICVLDN
ncbi:hypothetical protein JHK86_035278 [Glycine max]|nr:hypothetical protein JHK86_035278 [Glycine max]